METETPHNGMVVAIKDRLRTACNLGTSSLMNSDVGPLNVSEHHSLGSSP